MATNGFAVSTNAGYDVKNQSGGDVALDANEVALLQACVGFHAKAQSDPGIRDRLYQIWCKLDVLKQAA